MYIARILYPVEVLGPGKRIGIWVCGCPHHCKGCSNPELWDFNEQYSISIKNLMKLIKSISDINKVDGFTITGGEPFYQLGDLKNLTDELKAISDDILVYSGYTKEELTSINKSVVDEIFKSVAVLIDGRYIESRNNNCSLRGSDNQMIYVLSEKYRIKYDTYLKEPNHIQNFTIGKSVVSVGIHKPGFIKNYC